MYIYTNMFLPSARVLTNKSSEQQYNIHVHVSCMHALASNCGRKPYTRNEFKSTSISANVTFQKAALLHSCTAVGFNIASCQLPAAGEMGDVQSGEILVGPDYTVLSCSGGSADPRALVAWNHASTEIETCYVSWSCWIKF